MLLERQQMMAEISEVSEMHVGDPVELLAPGLTLSCFSSWI